MTVVDCPPGCVPVDALMDAAEVRRVARIKSRHTLIAWRRDREFPAPIATLSGGTDVYDRRAVKAWLKQQR